MIPVLTGVDQRYIRGCIAYDKWVLFDTDFAQTKVPYSLPFWATPNADQFCTMCNMKYMKHLKISLLD